MKNILKMLSPILLTALFACDNNSNTSAGVNTNPKTEHPAASASKEINSMGADFIYNGEKVVAISSDTKESGSKIITEDQINSIIELEKGVFESIPPDIPVVHKTGEDGRQYIVFERVNDSPQNVLIDGFYLQLVFDQNGNYLHGVAPR